LFFNKTVKIILDCEDKIMKKTMLLLLTVICVMVISYNTKPAFGDNGGNDAATCDITITVNSIVEWEGANFAAINLAAIDAQGDEPNDSSVYSLWTNSNVALSADQTTASELTHSGTVDTLVTKYKISTDGDGDPNTGATAVDVGLSGSDVWTTYDLFLETALAITHYNTDGRVEVTLEVQASNDADNVADTGAYAAQQTITATWVSDN
jgi:hypothetical protein